MGSSSGSQMYPDAGHLAQARPSNVDDIAGLMGISSGETLVLSHAFVTHDPSFPLMEPKRDAHLAQLGLLWTYGSDTPVLSSALLPGLSEKHWRPLGFTANAVEVRRPAGPFFPGDPVRYMLAGEHVALPADPLFLAMFVTPDLSNQGRTTTGYESSRRANSKASMRTLAQAVGLRLLPGGVAANWRECREIAAGLQFPIWLKTEGSGSDFVLRVTDSSGLEAAVRTLMSRACRFWSALPPTNRKEVPLLLHACQVLAESGAPILPDFEFPCLFIAGAGRHDRWRGGR